MKVCSLYGAGFYYMPGTDMCIKIGGWVRAETTWGVNGSSVTGTFNNDINDRVTNNLWTRERGYITADAREQTAYGVARGYIAVGISTNDNGNEAPSSLFSSNRAFVQWAGFTAGLSVSFFDFYPAAAMLYRAAQIPSEDTGDGGWWVWAYTAQFGGGFSATLSAEERRTAQMVIQTTADAVAAPSALPGGTFVGGSGYGGWQSPDVVANLRVDQAWGSAQVMGALHEDNPMYYAGGLGGVLPTEMINQYAGDTWGYAVGAGLKVNAPMISPGDFFVGEVNYTVGATRYLNHGPSGENELDQNGGTEAFGVGSDCVYGGAVTGGFTNGTACNLTTAYNFNVAYEHYWTPQWHQSFVGGEFWERYNSQANAILCSLEGAGNGAGVGTAAVATAGCNNDWSYWGVGSRLQWDVTKSFYIGVEAIYEQLNSGTTFNGLVPASLQVAGVNTGPVNVANQSNWTFTIRMHKDFLP